MYYKVPFFIFTLFSILISCSFGEKEDYSQLEEWRAELRTEMIQSRRDLMSTADLNIKSEIFINEHVKYYNWLKSKISPEYIDPACDDQTLKKHLIPQLEPVKLLISISDPKDDFFEIYPLPPEILHILGPNDAKGIENDEIELIDNNNLEWSVSYSRESLKLIKKDVWYIIPTKMTESVYKGCKL
tara:strand:- start:9716 stop:10273 length:558 start_codon:yes stop_codon:yes gene_type:complete